MLVLQKTEHYQTEKTDREDKNQLEVLVVMSVLDYSYIYITFANILNVISSPAFTWETTRLVAVPGPQGSETHWATSLPR